MKIGFCILLMFLSVSAKAEPLSYRCDFLVGDIVDAVIQGTLKSFFFSGNTSGVQISGIDAIVRSTTPGSDFESYLELVVQKQDFYASALFEIGSQHPILATMVDGTPAQIQCWRN